MRAVTARLRPQFTPARRQTCEGHASATSNGKPHNPAKRNTAMTSRKQSLLLMAVADIALLQGLTLWADARWAITYRETFIYLVAAGVAAKIFGDLIYYLTSPGRRHWLYLEDYLFNDLLVHTRFVVPMAIAQGWVAVKAPVYIPFAWLYLRQAWVSPLAGGIVWAVNRYLVERAEEQRHRPLGTRAASLTAKSGKGGDGSPPGPGRGG